MRCRRPLACVSQGAMGGMRLRRTLDAVYHVLSALSDSVLVPEAQSAGGTERRRGKLHEGVAPEVKQAPCRHAVPQVATVICWLLTMGAILWGTVATMESKSEMGSSLALA